MTIVKKELVKEEIITAAKEVFRKYGYKKTTMDDIAAALNRGKTSLYYYYKSKDELFQAVVDKEAEQMKERLIKAISSQPTNEKKIEQYILTRMQVLKELSMFYEAIQNELFDHLKYINLARQNFDVEEVQMLTALIQKGVNDGDFSVEKVNHSAEAILSILKGLEMQLFVELVDDKVLLKRMKEIVNIIISGIKKTMNTQS